MLALVTCYKYRDISTDTDTSIDTDTDTYTDKFTDTVAVALSAQSIR